MITHCNTRNNTWIYWPEKFGFSITGLGPVYVTQVERGSCAYLSGLLPGDEILDMDGVSVRRLSADDLKMKARRNFLHLPSLRVISRVKFVEVVPNNQGLGIQIDGLQPTRVLDIDLESPAIRAGIKRGDILLLINGSKIRDIESMQNFLDECEENVMIAVISVMDRGIMEKGMTDTVRARKTKHLFHRLDQVFGQDGRRSAVLDILQHYTEDKDIQSFSHGLSNLLNNPSHNSLAKEIRPFIPMGHRVYFDRVMDLDVPQVEIPQTPDLSREDSSASSLLTIKSISADTISERKVIVEIRNGRLGFTLKNTCPVSILHVDPGGPAEKVGLSTGDLILKVNSKDVRHFTKYQLMNLLKKNGPSIMFDIMFANTNEKEGRLVHFHPTESVASTDHVNDLGSSEERFSYQENVAFRQQINYLLTEEERDILKQALTTYSENQDIIMLVKDLDPILDSPSKRILWNYLLQLLSSHHQDYVLHVIPIPHHKLSRRWKYRNHRLPPINSFRQKIDCLLMEIERRQLKDALQSYSDNRIISKLVDTLSKILDTPSKQTLWPHILRLLPLSHQQYVNAKLAVVLRRSNSGQVTASVRKPLGHTADMMVEDMTALEAVNHRPPLLQISRSKHKDAPLEDDSCPKLLRVSKSPETLPKNYEVELKKLILKDDDSVRSMSVSDTYPQIEEAQSWHLPRSKSGSYNVKAAQKDNFIERKVRNNDRESTPTKGTCRGPFHNLFSFVCIDKSTDSNEDEAVSEYPNEIYVDNDILQDTEIFEMDEIPKIIVTNDSGIIDDNATSESRFEISDEIIDLTSEEPSEMDSFEDNTQADSSSIISDKLTEEKLAEEAIEALNNAVESYDHSPILKERLKKTSVSDLRDTKSDVTIMKNCKESNILDCNSIKKDNINPKMVDENQSRNITERNSSLKISLQNDIDDEVDDNDYIDRLETIEEVAEPSNGLNDNYGRQSQLPSLPPSDLTTSTSHSEKLENSSYQNIKPAGKESKQFKESTYSKQHTILNSKKVYNIGYLRISAAEFKRGLYSMDEQVITPALVAQLLQFAPNSTELEQLNLSSGKKLQEVDQFMYEVTRVPDFINRLKAINFRYNFEEKFEELTMSIKSIKRAALELRQSKKLATILEVILAIKRSEGLMLEATTFKIKLLIHLKNHKTRDLNLTFLQSLVCEINNNYYECLNLREDLLSVPTAAKVSELEISEELNRLAEDIEEVSSIVTSFNETRDSDDCFCDVMNTFLTETQASLQLLIKQQSMARREFENTAHFFGEDPSKIAEGQLFRIFNDFLLQFEEVQTKPISV